MAEIGAQGRGRPGIGYRLAKITQHLLRQRLDAELSAIGITAPRTRLCWLLPITRAFRMLPLGLGGLHHAADDAGHSRQLGARLRC